MNSSIDLSIIVPAKNTERYIGECLRSLAEINHSGFDYEVIIVDDGSTDNTREVASGFCERHSNMRIVDGPGMNLGEARIEGLKYAQGDYIGWVDSDDYVHPDMFQSLLGKAVETSAQIVLCDYCFFPSEISRKKKWFREINGRATPLTVERNTQLWNKIFDHKFLHEYGFSRMLNRCSDGACSLLLATADQIATVDSQLYYYRVGHASMSSEYSNLDKYADNVRLTKNQRALAEELNLDCDWVTYFDYRVIYSLLQLALISARNRNRMAYRKACAELRSMKYQDNKFLEPILSANHGKLKAFALCSIIPQFWSAAKCIGSLF